MAFDKDGTRFLLYAKSRGVDFSRTAMIGRQRLWLDRQRLRESLADVLANNLEDFGYKHVDVTRLLEEAEGYAEPFLKLLGCIEASSFDASPYEQATYLHDFNLPVPTRFHNKFTAVIDGGTLEHVFNFPVAIKNCMEMLEVGGHFVGITPANNACGHGFYQFSPELYFRVFSAENGFRIHNVFAYESCRKGKKPWFVAADPLEIRELLTFVNRRETYLLLQAERIEEKPIFATPPQQSYYTALAWDDRPDAPASLPSVSSFRQYVPEPLKFPLRLARRTLHRLLAAYRQFFSPFASKGFRRMNAPE